MSISSPKIDKREFDELIREFRQYAPFYTPDWDASNEQDSGVALSKVFAKILSYVIDRLNKAPQRNYIEFLNMLGVRLTPAQPARAYVTFMLSEGVKQDIFVAAGTKLTTAASEKHAELTFETEENMLATKAKLKEVYSVVSSLDAVYSHTLDLTKQDPFSFFSGHTGSDGNLQRHILYLGHGDILNIKKNAKIVLELTSNNAKQLKKILENANWEYNWKNNSKTGEEITASRLYVSKEVDATTSENKCTIVLSFANQGEVKFDKKSYETTDIISLKLIPTTDTTGIGIYTIKLISTTDPNGIIIPLTQTGVNTGIFIGTITLATTESSSAEKRLLRVKEGDTITAATTNYQSQDPKYASTASVINARGKPEIDKSKLNGIESRWIRCSIAPFEKSLDEEKEYWSSLAVPEISSILLRVEPDEIEPMIPDMFFYNDIPLNFEITTTGENFKQMVYPFGQKPLTLDTFYMANEEAFSKKGSKVTVTFSGIDLNFDKSNPVLSWEYWNGKGWARLKTEIKRKGTVAEGITKVGDGGSSGGGTPHPHEPLRIIKEIDSTLEVGFICPSDIETANVSGNENYWIKVRIASGDYGKEQLKPDDPANPTKWSVDTTNIKYPRLRSIKILYTMPPQYPEEILTYNNLEYRNDLIKLDGTSKIFSPFRKLEDEYPSIYFGFDQKVEKGPVILYFSLKEIELQEGSLPSLEYYYYTITGWKKLNVIDDTKDLTRRGIVKFLIPLDFAAHSRFGKNLYWLKAVDTKGRFAPKPYLLSWGEFLAAQSSSWNQQQEKAKEYLTRNLVICLDDPKAIALNELNMQLFSSFLGGGSGCNDGSSDVIKAIVKSYSFNLGTKKKKAILKICDKALQIFAVKQKEGRVNIHTENTPLPQVKGIFLNTVAANNVVTTDDEILGTSNGEASQTFKTANIPITCTSKFKNRVWVDEGRSLSEEEKKTLLEKKGEIEEIKDPSGNVIRTKVLWHEIDDIYTSTPAGRNYELDRTIGEILFGDGINGKIPPVGLENVTANYTAGGDSKGNVAVKEINTLKSAVPFVDSVINPEPAEGGLDGETIAKVLKRGPQGIKNRGQAVTAEDFEWLVREKFPSIAKVKCMPTTSMKGSFRPGHVTVVIIPASAEEKPVASLELLGRVEQFLDEHSSNVVVSANHLRVIRPIYMKVSVIVDIYPISIDLASISEQLAIAALNEFFNPLTGGIEGVGWEFGRIVCISDVYALLERIQEIDHIDNLSIRIELEEDVVLNGTRNIATMLLTDNTTTTNDIATTTSTATTAITTTTTTIMPSIPPHSIMYNGDHRVTLKLPEVL
jgi:baseplate J-like protein